MITKHTRGWEIDERNLKSMNLTHFHPKRIENLKKSNILVNIRFVPTTSDIRNFSQNIRSDVETSEVATLPSGMCAKLHTVAASNHRDHAPQSHHYCLFAPRIYIVVLHAHSVRGEPRIPALRYRRGCNNIPSFLQQTALIACSFCEGWTRHYLHILVRAPFCYDRKSQAACAQSFALWQQATMEIMRRKHSIIACSHHVYILFFFAHIPFVVNRAFQRNATGEVATVSTCLYTSADSCNTNIAG